MFQLKPLSREGIPAALEKAAHYRLLNEPGEAESICRDILEIDGQNQQALRILLLARTDRFAKNYTIGDGHIQELLPRLRDPYEKAYFAGIIAERRAKALLHHGSPGSGFSAFALLREAMAAYEQAEQIRPPGNDEALLRWNACARIIMANHLTERPEEAGEMQLE